MCMPSNDPPEERSCVYIACNTSSKCDVGVFCLGRQETWGIWASSSARERALRSNSLDRQSSCTTTRCALPHHELAPPCDRPLRVISHLRPVRGARPCDFVGAHLPHCSLTASIVPTTRIELNVAGHPSESDGNSASCRLLPDRVPRGGSWPILCQCAPPSYPWVRGSTAHV